MDQQSKQNPTNDNPTTENPTTNNPTSETKQAQPITYYKNQDGPVIGVSSKPVIEKDGAIYKDLVGDGVWRDYYDWHKTPVERAEALVKDLAPEEKIGLIFIGDKRMGIYQEDKTKVDATGLLDEEDKIGESIFTADKVFGTTKTIKELKARHFIFRQNPAPDDMAEWINQLNIVAEETEHAIPVLLASNSRNEVGELVFGMNDAGGVFPSWPGTLGIAAAFKGVEATEGSEKALEIIDDFALAIKKDWNATGLRKGYMYMADTVTDPRWQRSYGTFGEDPALITEIFEHLVPKVQGSEDGVTTDGVALTVKHFPGGGARENGFDPHYVQGQWNVYETEGSLQKYHLPTFEPAVKYNAASIMPYYSKPYEEKSAAQLDYNGEKIPFEPLGFAYNNYFIQEILYKQMGYKGYINSDSGIISKMGWGVEELDGPERIGLALWNGVALISGSLAIDEGLESYRRGKEGYYDTHPVPEKYTVNQITLTDENLDRAVIATLAEMFQLGLFENPYREAALAKATVSQALYWEKASKVHRQSVVLLKNRGALPLTAEKTSGKLIYAEYFRKDPEVAAKETAHLREVLAKRPSLNLTEKFEEADFAILFVDPQSGNYFTATEGYLELDICENKTVHKVDDLGRPAAETYEETTLADVAKIREIAEAVRANGGQVVTDVNFSLAWMLGNVEPSADALLASFFTYQEAVLDVIFGDFAPTVRLPITLPKDDTVLAVDENGHCVSRNDVPGYDKDLYMPASMKDENGKAYAYRDSEGNYYELNFGLGY